MSTPADLDLTACLAEPTARGDRGRRQPAAAARRRRERPGWCAPGGSSSSPCAAARRERRRRGRRRPQHLATLDGGELVASLDLGRQLRRSRPSSGASATRASPGAPSWRWATPAPGCSGCPPPPSASWRAGRSSPPALTRWLDGWVRRLTGEVVRGRPPKVFQELRPGAEVRLAEVGTARCAPPDGVVWVRHLDGSLRFLGRRRPGPRRPRTSSCRSPTRPGWSATARCGSLSCVDRERLLRSGGALGGARPLPPPAARLRRTGCARRTRSDERERLGRKTDLDRPTLETALRPAGLGARRPDRRGRAARRRLRPPARRLPAGRRGPGHRASAARRTRRPSCRQRRPARPDLRGVADPPPAGDPARRLVAPRQRPARGASGPRTTQQKRRPAGGPAAHLAPQLRAGRSGRADAARRSTPAVAESLAGEAYMFYPPLPERPLRLRDLLRPRLRGPPARPRDHPADGARRRPARAAGADPDRPALRQRHPGGRPRPPRPDHPGPDRSPRSPRRSSR